MIFTHPYRLTLVTVAGCLLTIAIAAAFVIDTVTASVITFLVLAVIVCTIARIDDYRRRHQPTLWEADRAQRQRDEVIENQEIKPW